MQRARPSIGSARVLEISQDKAAELEDLFVQGAEKRQQVRSSRDPAEKLSTTDRHC